MSARNNEAFKAYATSFVMKDLVNDISNEPIAANDQDGLDARAALISKLTFMYHYVMNFRSKYTRELKTNVRRRVITTEAHELGSSHLSSISFALKETKGLFDRKRIQIKGQLQGTMVETHQKWVHLNEQRAYEE